MQVRFLSLLAMTSALVAQSPVIYSNGSLVTGPGLAFGGGDHSELETALGYNLFGYGFQGALNNSCADNFATNGAWVVDGLEFFAYQTTPVGSPVVAPTINGIFLEIYDDDPSAGGVPIPGSPGLLNNLFSTAGYTVTTALTNIYRSTSAAPLNDQRRVQSVRVNLAVPLVFDSANLNGGRAYWVRVSMTGSLASGPWVPPVTTKGLLGRTGDGRQNVGGTTWQNMQDAGVPAFPVPIQQSLPFRLYGVSGSAPGAITNLGGSSGGPVSLAVTGQPGLSGSTLHVLTNTDPTVIPILVTGLSNPGLPFGVCAGVQRASLDFLDVGLTSRVLYLPMIPAAVGFTFYLQGLAIDFFGFAVPPLPCNLGLGFSFATSAGFEVRLW